MATRLFALLVVGVALCTSACERPGEPQWNRTRIQNDITERLIRRAQGNGLQTERDFLNLLPGLHLQTLHFLGLRGPEALERVPESDRDLFLRFHERLSRAQPARAAFGGLYVDFAAPAEELPPPARFTQTQAAALSNAWDQIQSSPRVSYRLMDPDDHSSISIMCTEHCQCIAENIITKLNRGSAFSADQLFIILTYPSDTSIGQIYTRTGSAWTYHATTLIYDGRGGWAVSDPMVLGNSRPKSVREWVRRFRNASELKFVVYPWQGYPSSLPAYE